MKQYIFILGHSTDLAKQEIINIIGVKQGSITTIGANFVVASNPLEAPALMSILGGTVKIAEVLARDKNIDQLNSDEWLSYLETELKHTKKNNFGFSLYDAPRSVYSQLYQLALELKKKLQAQKYKARLVSSRSLELSSVIITKNDLTNKELVLVQHKNKYLLGLTRAVQDFAKYSVRDYDRPGRDDRSGLLPPKVAQMMINLAGPDRSKTILDPFCGSGTLLQEAWLLGFKKIIGTDSNAQAISDSRQNLQWLKNKFFLPGSVDLAVCDVKNIASQIKNNSVDLIVSEPFMGPAAWVQRQTAAPSLLPLIDELSLLYQEAFRQFHLILKKSGQIVFVFPLFNLSGQKLPVLDPKKIETIGFRMIRPDISSDKLSARGNLVYSREGQKVQREITVWIKIA